MTLNIVLVEPQIPQNTGNVARTCAATGARLHLVGPMGFVIDDKKLKRSGLDYWHMLNVYYYDNYTDFVLKNNNPVVYMATTKAKKLYTEVDYEEDAFIMFGKESAGIPEEILVENRNTCIRVPMLSKYRSLNLSNSVSIILYEALRQQNFKGLLAQGELHKYKWSDI